MQNRKHSAWSLFEYFGTKWLGITLLLFVIPFVLIEQFEIEIQRKQELIWVVLSQVVTIVLSLGWMRKSGELTWNQKIKEDLLNGMAKVYRVKSNRVVKRYDYEDFGEGFYFEIEEKKTLFLQGQDFEEYQLKKSFPSTDFELIRSSLNPYLIIDVVSHGDFLKPFKKIPGFSPSDYSQGLAHMDGEILYESIEDLIH